MNTPPRVKLRELLGVYGPSLYQNPQFCGQLLRDACREYPAEAEVLLDALDVHVVDDLVRANSSTYPMVLPALVKRLQVERGMPEERARWAVDAWAGALGIASTLSLLPVNSASETQLSLIPPPPPSSTNNIYDAPTYNSKPFNPPETPRVHEQSRKPGRGRTFLIVGILCVVLVGSLSGFLAFSHGSFIPTLVASATATPTPVPYPTLSQSYGGRARNTTDKLDAIVSLTAISQNQGNLSGDMTVGLPLAGSGPFKGTISHAGAINFTVTSNDGSQETITFTGTLNKDGTMQGTYSINNGQGSNSQGGTFEASPAANPVVYPLLFANYSGSYLNDSTGKSGGMSLNISSQDQKTFKGTYTSTGNWTVSTSGSVDDKNNIQFTVTQPNGIVVKFVGTVNTDRSLRGTYTASSGVNGTWVMNAV